MKTRVFARKRIQLIAAASAIALGLVLSGAGVTMAADQNAGTTQQSNDQGMQKDKGMHKGKTKHKAKKTTKKKTHKKKTKKMKKEGSTAE